MVQVIKRDDEKLRYNMNPLLNAAADESSFTSVSRLLLRTARVSPLARAGPALLSPEA